MKTLGFIKYLEENDAYHEVETVLENYFRGSVITKDTVYSNEYSRFAEGVLNKGLLYTSDTKEGYEEYLKKSADRYGEDLVTALLYNQTLGSDYLIFYSLDKGYINLNKIDDIGYKANNTFFYENGMGYRVYYDNPYNARSYFELSGDEYDEFEEYYDDDIHTTYYDENTGSRKNAVFTTSTFGYEAYANECDSLQQEEEIVFSENTYGTRYHSDISYQTRAAISASKADGLVMIEDAYYGKTYYSGVYEITLNKDKLDVLNKEDFVSSDFFCHTREEYSELCKDYKSFTDEYKNALFAVLDESTGRFTTNLSSKDSKVTEKNVEKKIEKLCGSCVTFSSGNNTISTSDLFSNQVISVAYDFSDRLGDKTNFTIWAGFDRSLSGGIDPFSHIDSTASETAERIKQTATPVIICTLGWLICLGVLIFLTGRRSYDDELHMNRLDGIFTILRTALNLGLAALAVFGAAMLLMEVGGYYYDETLGRSIPHITDGLLKLACAACVIASLFIADWVLYIARHIKNRSLLKNISVIKLIGYLIRKSKQKKQERLLRDAAYSDFRNKIFRVMIPVLCVLDIAALIVIFWSSDYDAAFLLLIPFIAVAEFFLIRLFMKYVTAVREIFLSVHNMRTGEDVTPVDKAKMPSSLHAYADDINSVREGLAIAVENATREQRTKTELITNVSHDLKTPLTSIINYVDLLTKRPIEDYEARKYIGVLGEKSAKLKKLIEDLVEASKASAGNVQVNLVTLSLHELISQMVGEYEDDFASRGLSVFIEEKQSDITVSADSKLACRVIDNLMVNIKKYAMPGTRVYVRLFADEGCGCISISNISENQLNIPASELKERFVRGDESRSTEGSGLGLAIAEDFMSLQNGNLDLYINGDMFTAVVRFRQV